MMIIPDETGLKPCPFCGGTSLYLDQIGIDNAMEYFICCRGCYCEGPTGAIREQARQWWNERKEK
jgi:Lar family restriction alleviation protein